MTRIKSVSEPPGFGSQYEAMDVIPIFIIRFVRIVKFKKKHEVRVCVNFRIIKQWLIRCDSLQNAY